MRFIYQGKKLTINEKSLNDAEISTVKNLMQLGDSKNLALWTVEHIDRPRSAAYEAVALYPND